MINIPSKFFNFWEDVLTTYLVTLPVAIIYHFFGEKIKRIIDVQTVESKGLLWVT